MKLLMFHYRCLACGCQFESPESLPSTYGQFLARSTLSDQRALLNALDDPVYSEVAGILDRLGFAVGLDDNKKADLLLRVFGKTCDPAVDGSDYLVAARPQCPRCRSRDRLSWQACDPPRFCEEDLPGMTHRRWSQLDADEKIRRLKDAVGACSA
jgi:hypothetical protein